MNSLFNNLTSLFGNKQNMFPMKTNNTQPNILMQAIGAALRGESPQEFMQKLATQHPELKQYDLSNLQQTAQQVCQQNNVDMQNAINQIDNITSSFM